VRSASPWACSADPIGRAAGTAEDEAGPLAVRPIRRVGPIGRMGMGLGLDSVRPDERRQDWPGGIIEWVFTGLTLGARGDPDGEDEWSACWCGRMHQR